MSCLSNGTNIPSYGRLLVKNNDPILLRPAALTFLSFLRSVVFPLLPEERAASVPLCTLRWLLPRRPPPLRLPVFSYAFYGISSCSSFFRTISSSESYVVKSHRVASLAENLPSPPLTTYFPRPPGSSSPWSFCPISEHRAFIVPRYSLDPCRTEGRQRRPVA